MAELEFQSSVLSDVLLPLALGVIMLGMGMSLSGADFARVARSPRAVAVGIVGQFILLPALAILVALVSIRVLGWTPAFATGLLLLACCPGGATSNLLTHLARADSALSVTLTSLTSLASVLVTPATFLLGTSLVLAEGERIRIGFAEMAGLVALLVVLPILLGMGARRRWPELARRSERAVRLLSIGLFAAIVLGLMIAHRADLLQVALQTGPSALLLNVLALTGGYALARLAGTRRAAARAISIEVGFQNATLAIALAITQLNAPSVAVVPAFYSLMMFATGGALAWIWSRRAVAEEPTASPTSDLGDAAPR